MVHTLPEELLNVIDVNPDITNKEIVDIAEKTGIIQPNEGFKAIANNVDELTAEIISVIGKKNKRAKKGKNFGNMGTVLSVSTSGTRLFGRFDVEMEENVYKNPKEYLAKLIEAAKDLSFADKQKAEVLDNYFQYCQESLRKEAAKPSNAKDVYFQAGTVRTLVSNVLATSEIGTVSDKYFEELKY